MFVPSVESSLEVNNTDSFYVNDENTELISFCKSFKYLGSTINELMDDTEDISNRIKIATSAFALMKNNILCNKRVHLQLRLQLYLAIPINLLLWGCESWAFTAEHKRKIRGFHWRCLCQMAKRYSEK